MQAAKIQNPDNLRLFCGFLGKIKIDGLDISSENIRLQVNTHGLNIRVVDAVATGLALQVPIQESRVIIAPTMTISRTNNTFYGLVACLAWTLYHKESSKKQWWQSQFDKYVGDRPAFFNRAQKEYPMDFTSTTIATSKLAVLRHALVQLMGVDSLHSARMFADYLKSTFGEVNINHLRSLPIIVNVPKLQNAYFSKSFIVVGNGGPNMLPLCTADIIAHELAHGVTRGHNGLKYQDESGALSEHMSDVLGGFACERYIYKMYNNNVDNEDDIFGSSDYLFGEELMLNGTSCIRNMSDPEACFQPSMVNGRYWHNYTQDSRDNGGVHINSSIPSFLFYTICQTNSVDETLKLWYNCLKVMPYACTFQQFEEILLQISRNDPVIKAGCELVKLSLKPN